MLTITEKKKLRILNLQKKVKENRLLIVSSLLALGMASALYLSMLYQVKALDKEITLTEAFNRPQIFFLRKDTFTIED